MPLGIPRGARCVQRFDDSLNSAIHITYRISLRSSSMREPRDPLLKVVYSFYRCKDPFKNMTFCYLLECVIKIRHRSIGHPEQGMSTSNKPQKRSSFKASYSHPLNPSSYLHRPGVDTPSRNVDITSDKPLKSKLSLAFCASSFGLQLCTGG